MYCGLYNLSDEELKKYVRSLFLPEIRVFVAASRVLDKHAERIPQKYIDAAWRLGLLETELDCDPPYVYPTPTQKFLDLQDKYYALVRPEIFA